MKKQKKLALQYQKILIFPISQKKGYTIEEIEMAYDGKWYLQGFAPEKPAPTNEEIKAERERLYVLYTDKLKNDYDEDVARYGLESSEALASKKIWLDKKDEIRENNSYLEEV